MCECGVYEIVGWFDVVRLAWRTQHFRQNAVVYVWCMFMSVQRESAESPCCVRVADNLCSRGMSVHVCLFACVYVPYNVCMFVCDCV